MFNRILQPLFGEKQSQLLNGKRIASGFNAQDMNCFLRGYNEVFSANDNKGNQSRKEWLKDAITSKKQTIEYKGKDTFQADNFMNFIIFSNNENPILIDKKDRRFNVIRNLNAKKVEKLSFYTGQKDLEPAIERELSNFAEIVFTVEYNIELVNLPIESEAKRNIIALSSDSFDDFAQALKTKNADYFLLNEVFPPNIEEKLMSGKYVQSEISKDVENVILTHGAILSKYMQEVVRYHFPNFTYKMALDRLKSRGIQSCPIRLGSETVKAYKIRELQPECNQAATGL